MLPDSLPAPILNAADIIQNAIAQMLASIPAVLIALIIFFIIYRAANPIANVVEEGLKRANRSRSLQLIFVRLTRWTVILTAFLFAAMIALPDFSPSELLSLLGIGSVAIGFAFRDILQNFLAGILILLTEPFKIGDQIIASNYEGTVEDIQIRATMLKTYDNRRVVIPNSELFTDSVTVNTAYAYRRSQYDVGIGYSDNIEAAQKLCLDVMKSIEGVLEHPAPDTFMTEMGDSAVVFRVRWWTDPQMANVLKVQDKVLRTIKNRLTEEGFDIPFPIRTVYMHNSD
ncbi:MAG: mechanosensitive ion channel family protein [Phototrophicaceae bacterium]